MEKEDLLYSIDAYFINKRLVFSILDKSSRNRLEKNLEVSSSLLDPYKELSVNCNHIDEVINYLTTKKVQSLDKALLENRLIKDGQLIYSENSFFFKGLSDACRKRKSGELAYADFHTKLSRFNNFEVLGKYNPEHITCSSAFAKMSGNQKLFIFGKVDAIQGNSLRLNPIIVGDRVLSDSRFLGRSNDGRVMPEDIDEFECLKDVDRRILDIVEMKSYSESQVKNWIGEIIGEKNIPKDWGGERSDLFTTHLHIKGKRLRAAFIFKGPSPFHPMAIKDLGANGDQITRLFDEPAEVFILQHCHYVRSQVEKMMSAFASRFYAISYYCIIDGIDTLRILKGYNKI